MANVSTVVVRLLTRRDASLDATPDQILERLADGWDGLWGFTTWVPAWSRAHDGIVDLQFGSKGASTLAAEHLWERFGDALDELWTRDADQGGDSDHIHHIDHAGTSPWRECLYGFDAVRLTARPRAGDRLPAALHASGLPWRAVGSRWVLELTGTYRAKNERSVYEHDDVPLLPTPTTPTPGRPESGWPWGEFEDRPGPLHELLADAAGDLAQLELLWNGRPVRVDARGGFERVGPDGLRRLYLDPDHERDLAIVWTLDGWDNCADADWLAVRGGTPQRRSVGST